MPGSQYNLLVSQKKSCTRDYKKLTRVKRNASARSNTKYWNRQWVRRPTIENFKSDVKKAFQSPHQKMNTCSPMSKNSLNYCLTSLDGLSTYQCSTMTFYKAKRAEFEVWCRHELSKYTKLLRANPLTRQSHSSFESLAHCSWELIPSETVSHGTKSNRNVQQSTTCSYSIFCNCLGVVGGWIPWICEYGKTCFVFGKSGPPF